MGSRGVVRGRWGRAGVGVGWVGLLGRAGGGGTWFGAGLLWGGGGEGRSGNFGGEGVLKIVSYRYLGFWVLFFGVVVMAIGGCCLKILFLVVVVGGCGWWLFLFGALPFLVGETFDNVNFSERTFQHRGALSTGGKRSPQSRTYMYHFKGLVILILNSHSDTARHCRSMNVEKGRYDPHSAASSCPDDPKGFPSDAGPDQVAAL